MSNTAAAAMNIRPRRRSEVRDPYDGLRPWSAVTHGVGAALALAGTVALLVGRPGRAGGCCSGCSPSTDCL